MDPDFEFRCDQRKASWKSRFRWATPQPETWCSLSGEVSDHAINRIINALDQAPQAPVFLTVDLHGGDPLAGFDLYNAIRSHAAPVTTSAGARCHSAALLVFLAGDARIAASGSRFVVHGAACEPLGRPSAPTLRDGARFLDDIDSRIANLVCIRAGRYPAWQLRADMAAEITLDGATAQLRGLATILVVD